MNWASPLKTLELFVTLEIQQKKAPIPGYIRQKNTAFMSIIWVTVSPKTHSNGFHMKFDITEEELGFILPIPSLCNLDLFSIYLAIGNEKLGNCLEYMHGYSF